MRPNKPLKEYALGVRTVSKLNRSFNTIFFICKESWDTIGEAEEYISKHPDWKKGAHSSAAILRLTPTERKEYGG